MKPRVAITMGDPGGIGPEVLIKALARPETIAALRPVIIGDIKVLESTARRLQAYLRFQQVACIDQQAFDLEAGAVAVLQPYADSPAFSVGSVNAINGKASHSYIAEAARAALANEVDAICTAPIAKEALFAAGSKFPGHTEMLADACGQEVVRMMLVGGGLRVVLQTIHVALKDVPPLITKAGILQSLEIISDFALKTGIPACRIAVCGLNPHAGEGGHFGREEPNVIMPAVLQAREHGMNVSGPLPADTVFYRSLHGDFDFVLAMYHDQGLIPVKTLDFHGGVNVTLGLPILRTSPDHGTAFDLAGKNMADESSMVAALLYAASIAGGN